MLRAKVSNVDCRSVDLAADIYVPCTEGLTL